MRVNTLPMLCSKLWELEMDYHSNNVFYVDLKDLLRVKQWIKLNAEYVLTICKSFQSFSLPHTDVKEHLPTFTSEYQVLYSSYEIKSCYNF